jgi:phage-related minor tail protein
MARGRNIKGITIELNGDATGLDKALSGINGNISSLEAQLKDVDRLLKLDPGNTELLRQQQTLLAQAAEETKNKLEMLKKANEEVSKSADNYDAWKAKYDPIQKEISETKEKLKELQNEQQSMKDAGEINTDAYNALQNEITETKTKLSELKTEAKQVTEEFGAPINPEQYNALQREIVATQQKLEQLGEKSETASEKLSGIGKNISAQTIMTAAENLSAVGEKIKEVGSSAVESANDMQSAQQKIAANLDVSKQKTQEYGKAAQEVFEQGVVEDANEAADAIIAVKQNMSDLNDTDLSKVAGQLAIISERTGTDVKENTVAVGKLMKNFGLSSKEAMDLLAAGYKNGLNSSDDFMDTINEYSPLFKTAGYSGKEMFQLLKNGMENGAMNTDKAADALKEFQIRLGDGTFKGNINSFSSNTKKVFGEWEKGKATVKDVAESVGNDLKKMSPKEQQEALSTLSTQFEDLGIDASVALFGVGNDFDNVKGKAKEMSKQTPGEKWEGALRKLQDSLIPIGTQIVTALQPIVNVISTIAQAFGSLPGPIQTVIIAITGLIALFTTLAPAIAAIMTIFTTLSATALVPFLPIIAGVIAAITAVIAIIRNWSTITTFLGNVWNAVKSAVSSAVNAIGSVIMTVFGAVKTFISTVWNGIKTAIITTVNAIKTVITTVFNAIKTVVTTVFNAVKTVVTTVWNGIKTAITTVVNAIKTVITTVFNGIRSVITTVTSTIKSVAVGAFTKMRSGIKTVVSTIAGIVKGPFNTIKGFIFGLARSAYHWGSDFINGLKNGIFSGINKIVEGVKGLAGKIRSFLHFSRPDEGPLRDYETWMPDFIDGLAKGIDKNVYKVKDAMQSVADQMNAGIITNLNGLQTAGASVNLNNAVTVQVGNHEFDAYIVKTAEKGINNNRITSNRFRGR